MLHTIAAHNSMPALLNYYFWKAVWRATGFEKTVRVRLYGRRLYVRTGFPDLTVAFGNLGSEFDAILDRYPRASTGLIIDAGGYIGTAAIKFAEAYPECEVVTIEPSSENIRILRKNVAGMDNIVVVHAALAPASGDVTLRDRATGQWGFTTVEQPADTDRAEPIEVVPTITLPEVLARSGKDRIDILKLDIEGGEHALLSRNTEWISWTRIIVAELHDRIVPGCSDVFSQATEGRVNYRTDGEKVVSEAADLLE